MTLTSSPKNRCHSKAQKRACHPHPPCPTFPYVHGVWELRVRRPWEPPWPPSPGRERRSKTVKVTRQRPWLCINPQPGGPSPWERARPFCTPSGKPGKKSFKVVRAPTVCSRTTQIQHIIHSISIFYFYVGVHTSCVYIYMSIYCIVLYYFIGSEAPALVKRFKASLHFWSRSLATLLPCQGVPEVIQSGILPQCGTTIFHCNLARVWQVSNDMLIKKASYFCLSIHIQCVCIYIYNYIYI